MKKFYFLFPSLLLYLTSCATINESEIINPGQKPSLETTEGGLWAQLDKIEEDVKESGRRVKDEKLNRYIKKLVCDLAGNYCPDIRPYILDIPLFNATMSPNGMMQIYTGLLLRMQNEAQLATVLGHEITHYVKRHSIKSFLDARSKIDALTVFSIGIGASGIPLSFLINTGANLAVIGSITAYSRDHEREADLGGINLLSKSGYSLEEAPTVWKNILKEKNEGEDQAYSIFFATHPPSEERIQNLEKESKKLFTITNTKKNNDEFLEKVLPLRGQWFKEELMRGKFDKSKIVLQNLAPSHLFPGELHFFKGELIHKQKKIDYQEKSIIEYKKAVELDETDPRPRKELGLMLMKNKKNEEALLHLKKFLELNPTEEDSEIIKSIIQNLEQI
jgi:beta-barrel assembly-enhancing protease